MKTQRGSALVISLVLMLVLTIAGLSSMQGTALQQQMTVGQEELEVTFQAAESSLRTLEAFVGNTPFTTADFVEGCSGSRCFTNDCTNGFCRSVDYTDINDGYDCVPRAEEVWRRDGIWDNGSSAGTQLVKARSSTNQNITTRYLIEFRCYVKKIENPNVAFKDSEWSEYYRITVLATGLSSQSKVLLQSTMKKN